jgi:hypothetical protein
MSTLIFTTCRGISGAPTTALATLTVMEPMARVTSDSNIALVPKQQPQRATGNAGPTIAAASRVKAFGLRRAAD